jgi:hypothetical protein
MPEINPFTVIGAAVVDLLTQHSILFLDTGTRLFRGLAVIMVAWFGIKAALSSAEGSSAIPLSNLASLLLLIAFGHAMLTYYAAPLPGIGRSFTHLITDEAQTLAAQMETSQVQSLSDHLNTLLVDIEVPLTPTLLHLMGYLLVSLTVTAARVALVAVIAFGWVATAVAVLVGPIFIPFLLVPSMHWIFWGWLRSLIQYAFYQVVAQAFVFVFGTFLVHQLDAFLPPYTIDKLLVGGFHLAFLLMAFTYGLFKVPSLTHSLFSGASGERALPGSGFGLWA